MRSEGGFARQLLRADLVLIAAALIASGLGAALVHSATRADSGSARPDAG